MNRSVHAGLVPLTLLTLTFFLNFAARIVCAPLLPALESELGISHGTAGSFFLCSSLGYFLSLAGSGFISSRLHHDRTIIASALAVGGALVLLSLQHSVPALQTCFFLVGLGAGIYLPSAVATIAELFPPYSLGRAFGVHELAPNLAFLLAPVYTAAVAPTLGWRQSVLLLALFMLIMALLNAVCRTGVRKPGTAPLPSQCRRLLARPSFWTLTLIFSLGISSTLGVYSMLPIYLVSEHQLSEQTANLLVGSSRIPTLCTALLGGWLADRFGHRRTMGAVLAITGITTALLGFPTGHITLLVWLQPLVAVCFFPAAFATLARIAIPADRTLIISLAIPLAFLLGAGIVPAIIAQLAEMGYFGLGFAGTGACISLSALLVRAFPAHAAADQDSETPDRRP